MKLLKQAEYMAATGFYPPPRQSPSLGAGPYKASQACERFRSTPCVTPWWRRLQSSVSLYLQPTY